MADALPARLRALGEFIFATGVPATIPGRINREADANRLLQEAAQALEIMSATLRTISRTSDCKESRLYAARTLQQTEMWGRS